MFRNPGFFRAVRKQVVPWLRTYPFIRLWCAGCSTGEEVYSLAILLHEEGLYDRCRIYATDMNEAVLRKAKEGIFTVALMREYTTNYVKAGSQGVAKVKARGGFVVVQDPRTAESHLMPEAAIAATDVERILPLVEIGPCVAALGRSGRR
jgi:hypothetical protein